jgi:hypothetical protein
MISAGWGHLNDLYKPFYPENVENYHLGCSSPLQCIIDRTFTASIDRTFTASTTNGSICGQHSNAFSAFGLHLDTPSNWKVTHSVTAA